MGSGSGGGGAGGSSALAPNTNLAAILEGTKIAFHRVWELTSESPEVTAYGPSDETLHQSRRAKIAKYVAATAQVRYYFLI